MRGVPESLALSIVIDATCWREDISLPHDCGSDKSRRMFWPSHEFEGVHQQLRASRALLPRCGRMHR